MVFMGPRLKQKKEKILLENAVIFCVAEGSRTKYNECGSARSTQGERN